MPATVEIYTTPTCPFCHRAKRLLDKRGVSYREIDAADAATRKAMTERAEGRYTVPQIFINGQGIGGCDELFSLDFEGELTPMLKGED